MLAFAHSLRMSVVLPGSSTRSHSWCAADQSPQLGPLRAVTEDAEPPVRDLVGDLGEGGDQLAELLLPDQPAGRDDESGVEP